MALLGLGALVCTQMMRGLCTYCVLKYARPHPVDLAALQASVTACRWVLMHGQPS
jgi:hypothetical protein